MAKQKAIIIVMDPDKLRIVPHGDVTIKDFKKVLRFLGREYKEEQDSTKLKDITYGGSQ